MDRITLQIDLWEQDMSKSREGIHKQPRGEIWYLQRKIVDFHTSYCVLAKKQSLEVALPVFTRIGNKHVVNGYLDIYAPLKANQGIPNRPHICLFFSTQIFSTQIFLHIDLEQKRHKLW